MQKEGGISDVVLIVVGEIVVTRDSKYVIRAALGVFCIVPSM